MKDNPKKEMLHFGAGNIGRGLIAPFMQSSNYEINFVDINKEIIDRLSNAEEYKVSYWDDSEATVINTYQAHYDTENSEFIELFCRVSLVTTAVTPKGLNFVARTLAKLLEHRLNVKEKLVVLAFENMQYATSHLEKLILSYASNEVEEYINEYVYYANTAIDRNVPTQISDDGLSLNVEKYHELIIEDGKSMVPDIDGITRVEDLSPFIERKLFLVNNAHAACGYFASYHGFTDMKPAFQNEEVKEFLKSILTETEKVLKHKYPETQQLIEEYAVQTFHRFTVDFRNDSISRVSRNPKQKLSYNERILSPIRQYIESFLELPDYMSTSVAYGLMYCDSNDSEAQEIQALIKEKGIEQAVTEITGIEAYSQLHEKIITKYIELETRI